MRDLMPPQVLRWGGGATWWAGSDALEQALRPALEGRDRVRVVMDATVAATPDGRSLLDRTAALAAATGCEVLEWRHDASRPVTTDDVERAAVAWTHEPADAVVIVGGGSTIDLGVLALLPPEERALLAARGRSGLVLLPETSRTRPVTVAVPTTLGTGAEVSAAACVEHDGKRLAVGAWLRPDIAVSDPAATAGLPEHLVREAVVEVAARLIVPFASRWQDGLVHPLTHVLGDEVAKADLRVLLRLAEVVAAGAADGGAGGSDELTRISLAAVSAHSHAGFANVGRASFSSPLWFVATELAHVLGASKVAATALILPAWARAVQQGDRVWGDAGRLGALSAAVGATDPVLLTDHLCALVDVPPLRADADEVVDLVAFRSMRRWGGGLPILAGITAQDVAGLVGSALASGRQVAA